MLQGCKVWNLKEIKHIPREPVGRFSSTRAWRPPIITGEAWKQGNKLNKKILLKQLGNAKNSCKQLKERLCIWFHKAPSCTFSLSGKSDYPKVLLSSLCLENFLVAGIRQEGCFLWLSLNYMACRVDLSMTCSSKFFCPGIWHHTL